jgi:WXG100 family type VII secretion target
MSASSEIRSVASTVNTARSAISQKNSTFERGAAAVGSEWKGDIGTAFKDATRRIRSKMNAVSRGYSDLNSRLSRLASSVDRAEREERLKQERAASGYA